MDLEAIQGALQEAGLDGWLFFDFHHRDLMAYRILGMEPGSMTTRRWFYYLPARGEPVKLAHRVEPHKLDALPGKQLNYLSWKELHAALKAILKDAGKVAMQYSPMNSIPYVSVADAGTVELVRSFGCELVSSADLVQRFEAVAGEDGYRSHCEAGELVQKIKDQAFDLMRRALHEGHPIAEHEVQAFILERFQEEGLTSDGDGPIVGYNDHPADPHFEPKPHDSYGLRPGDTILVDLWARQERPGAFYYDITWCGFAGTDPPEEYVKIFGVVRDARDAALEFARRRFETGEPCHGWEVDDACRAVVEKAGYGPYFIHRTGHNIGTSVHGNGVNIDNLETRDDRMLIPGICFSVEPGIYLPGRMAVRTEIDVFITPEGKVEVSGPMQRDLILLG